MIEILKFILNYKEAGVALFFAVLFYFDFRKKIISLDHTISNDLFHIIYEDSKNTIATGEVMKEVRDTNIQTKEAIKDLTIEIKKMKI